MTRHDNGRLRVRIARITLLASCLLAGCGIGVRGKYLGRSVRAQFPCAADGYDYQKIGRKNSGLYEVRACEDADGVFRRRAIFQCSTRACASLTDAARMHTAAALRCDPRSIEVTTYLRPFLHLARGCGQDLVYECSMQHHEVHCDYVPPATAQPPEQYPVAY